METIFRSSSGLWAVRDKSRVYYRTTGDTPVTGREEYNLNQEGGGYLQGRPLFGIHPSFRRKNYNEELGDQSPKPFLLVLRSAL
ncbi:MAG: hypothetical protein RAO92_08525 [Candidatus Euphemobacter frigidus]|nr:hypothetical protein [Candidatus Euphemobacter frigidus]MDP8276432.1 hypothetical protein [Candidatus Euphemobacter frigidus]